MVLELEWPLKMDEKSSIEDEQEAAKDCLHRFKFKLFYNN